MPQSEKSYKDFLLGVIIGGSLGATSAVIFGTKQGKKVQKEILHKYHEMKHAAEHYLEKNGMMAKAPKKAKAKTRKKRRS